MTVKELPRRVWRRRRTALRLQRDLWLAQLALWPAVILSAILVSVAARALWQRKSRPPQPEEAAPGTDSAVAGAPGGQLGLSG
ncbi:hypothetical protein BRW65_04800 [Mycobacterium paraffinicum]|uniref:Uncharacterized protein n=1 Tax=Mycobacterium paraffinicum TaxID=53378 RepID=A0A1Q4HZV5_9MYCO|nr:hypothetical protein [Mycobacterium paraffinicum]OJZ75148.1 hypothetical protein BRW65_04800 [Mycobacterium paraffinicum]